MKAENGKYVSINYVLKNDEGTIIDQSNEEPLGFVQGLHYILPKLEDAILGHEAGDKLSVVLEAKDGYGEYNEHLIAEVERKMFETDMPIEVGMAFQAMTAVGPQIVRVTKVGEDKITVDANHELAGVRLHFDVEVAEVRDATEEELNPQSCGCGGCGGGCGGNCGDDCNCGGGCEGCGN